MARPRLEEFIADKGLINRASFLGNQLDVTSLLEESHMYLSCYQIGRAYRFQLLKQCEQDFRLKLRMWAVSMS